jgi:two-component system NtrC family sensor kinase
LVALDPSSRPAALLVAGDEELIERVRRLLPEADFRLLTASEVGAGAELAARECPALVLVEPRLLGAGEADLLASAAERAGAQLLLMHDGEVGGGAAGEQAIESVCISPGGESPAGNPLRAAFERRLLEENRRLRARARASDDRIAELSGALHDWERTFNDIDEPLAVLSRDLMVMRANRAYRRLAGARGSELVGMACHRALFGSDHPCEACPVARSETPMAPVELAAGGRSYSMHCFEGGERLICLCRETTEERVLTRRAMQTEKLAAIGQLAAGIAHEINNPLGGMLAFTQLMLRDEGRSEQDVEMLREVEKAALRCKRIVGGLLNFSRRRQSGQSSFDLNQLAEDVALLFRPQLKGPAAVVFHQELWPVPLRVRGDATEIEQVALNLLVNALQAFHGGPGTITLRTGEQGGLVELTVSDDGPGIAPELLSRIFEPTFTTKPPGVGTGLGLAVAWSIAERHGGSIEAKSELGKGATFTLKLPAAAENAGGDVDHGSGGA